MDRRFASRLLGIALAAGLIGQALLVHAMPGVNLTLLSLGLLATATMVAARGRRIDRLDLWLPAAAAAVLAGIAFRADPTLLVLDLAVGLALLGATTAALAGMGVTRRSALAIGQLGVLVVAWCGLGILSLTAAARRPAGDPGPRLPAWLGPLARGVAIAIPVVALFAGLFSSADEVFARLTDDLLGIHVDLGELPIRVSIAFLVAWIAAGLLAVAAGLPEPDEPVPPVPQSLGAAAARPAPALPRLGLTEALTVLVAVDLLFAVFVGLQVAYLFGGLDTLSISGMTYADYARRGFFELVAVTSLAGLLVAGLDAVVVRRTRWFVGAAVAVALLNTAILASAALRLRLYQDAYGWTELRFYVYAAIAWLAIGIVVATVLLVRDRMRWLPHAMAVSAVAILVALNVVGPQRHVAEQNVARLLDPSLVPADGRHGLDIGYAVDLGDEAIPALVAALPALTADERSQVEALLHERWLALGAPEATAWPAWNLGRERAREALGSLFGERPR